MRGLESLIPQRRDNQDNDRVSPNESVFMIDIEKIRPNPFQPRKEFSKDELADLSSSVKQYGILQPLIVTKVEKDKPGGRDVEYELIAGERRLRAAKAANLPRVPVVVRHRTTPPEKLAISLIENVQREDLNPIEEALAFERLHKEFGMSQADIAQQVGKSRVVITNAIRMLKLPEVMRQAVFEGKIPMANSRFLLTLQARPDKQRKLFDEMTKRNLDASTAQARLWELQKEDGAEARPRALVARADPELDELAEKMKDSLGLHGVKINRIGRRARIFIEFPSKNQLIDWTKRFLS